YPRGHRSDRRRQRHVRDRLPSRDLVDGQDQGAGGQDPGHAQSRGAQEGTADERCPALRPASVGINPRWPYGLDNSHRDTSTAKGGSIVVAPYTTDPIRVIDADSHLTEPPGLWVDHAPAKFKERVPRVIEDEQGRAHWVVDGKTWGPIGFTAFGPDGAKVAGDTTQVEWRFADVHP